MHILILAQYYPFDHNSYGGIFVKQQAQIISRHHQVTVLSFNVDYSWFSLLPNYKVYEKKESQLTEIKLIIARSIPFYNQINYFLSAWLFLKKDLLKRNSFNLVHAHMSYPAAVLGLIIKKFNSIPYLLTEHSHLKSQYRSIFHKFFIKIAYKKADQIIAVSSFLKNEIEYEFKITAIVIPNVVDISKFQISKTQSPFLEIGFIGNFNNQNKGLDILLLACKRIKFPYRLHIAGDGILKEYYIKLAKDINILDSCKFYGQLNSDQTKRFYSQLNLFVLTSRYETFGIVLIEAMASGLPVISTRCGGPIDIVTKETGLMIEIDDIEGLTNGIEYIKNNSKNYPPEQIRKYVNTRFGVEIFLSSILPLYDTKSKSYDN